MTVKPRPASTIVLMDQNSRVYLTKRPDTMKFFGGYFVFPGGSVDKADYLVDNQFMRNGMMDNSFNQVHYVSVVRELFEEVGILLCCKDGGTLLNLNEDAKIEYRNQLINKEISFLQLLQKEKLYINLGMIKYFGHRITSKERPLRFDTRFFLAQLPTGQIPQPDLTEIDEANWFTPLEALRAFEKNEILLPPPTILALKAIIEYQEGGPLTMK